MKSIEKSAKNGPKKDLFKFESVNTSMGHMVVRISFNSLLITDLLPFENLLNSKSQEKRSHKIIPNTLVLR